MCILQPSLTVSSYRYVPRDIFEDVSKKVHAVLFVTVLLVLANVSKQPRCLLTGEWINNLGWAHKVEYHAELAGQQGCTSQIQ